MGKKSYAAEVLDDADRVSTQMDWVLFSHEQNSRLFGASDVQWRPGDPLGEVMVGAWFVFDEESLNETRARERRVLQRPRDDAEIAEPRCGDCDVTWDGPQPCFICGKQRMDANSYRFYSTTTSAEWRAAHGDKAEKHEQQMHKLILGILRNETGAGLNSLIDYAAEDALMSARLNAGFPRLSNPSVELTVTGRRRSRLLPDPPRYHHPRAGLQSVPMPGTRSPECASFADFVRVQMDRGRPRDSIRIMSMPDLMPIHRYTDEQLEMPIQAVTTIYEVMTFWADAPFVGDAALQRGRYVWRAAVDDEGRYVASEVVRLVIDPMMPRGFGIAAHVTIITDDGEVLDLSGTTPNQER